MLDLPCSFLMLNKALRGLSLSGLVLAFSFQEGLEAPPPSEESPPSTSSLELALFSSWLLLKQIIFLESPSLSSADLFSFIFFALGPLLKGSISIFLFVSLGPTIKLYTFSLIFSDNFAKKGNILHHCAHF